MGVEWAARYALRAGTLGAVVACGAGSALSQEAASSAAKPLISAFQMPNVTGLAVLVGLTVFATILSLLHLRERARWAKREHDLLTNVSSLRGAHDRAELMLSAERQLMISWAGREAPLIEGDPSVTRLGELDDIGQVLAFDTWLLPQDSTVLAEAVDALRQRGTRFRCNLRGRAGQSVEAQGQALGGRALLRLRETTEERRQLVEQSRLLDEARRGLTAFAGLLDAIPQPVWQRDHAGALVFVNAAYIHAVEGRTREATLATQTELLDRSDRDQVARRSAEISATVRVSGVVAGERRILDVTESQVGGTRVGIAIDVSDLESAHQSLKSQIDANVRTLDQLPTAVAMFDASQRLVFHNAAYQKLWGLDPLFLESEPRDGEILDRLRAERKLPEQADFRTWKADMLAAYRSVEATEVPWYLPDGRALRVLADPNPQGGLTYLYQDISENMRLASDVSRLTRVQAETLDALREPVAVFSADGRLTIANQAFRTTWRLDEKTVAEQPRIDAVIAVCRTLSIDAAPWLEIRAFVTGLEARTGLARRLELINGEVLDCTAQPLVEGATLLTFIDVTASVNVERALTRENEALERAAQLRDTFVHHVSYELRSPLTTVIGFAQLLGVETVGPLNDRQREYTQHITRSSTALLAIINDILDLASIDARSLELKHETVDVSETIEASVQGVEDRLAESKIVLERDVPADIGAFEADGKRVRQILFNLLSNAIGFSSEGQIVRVAARRIDGDVVLQVTDQGRGIPEEVIARVFDRFESHTLGTKHRGVGLGLSIVRSFVELHGGRVAIDSKPGTGTSVTCTFPSKPDGNREAAE